MKKSPIKFILILFVLVLSGCAAQQKVR
ncbi:MAG: lipoprotein [Anaerolineales bacterium]|nr:lipoprotein [Anaerolineales bacterium]